MANEQHHRCCQLQHILIRKQICRCCSLIYPEMLSSFITCDGTDWKCCSNPVSLPPTLLSCQMLFWVLPVRNKRKRARGLPLIFLLSLWVTQFAFQIVFNWLITIHANTEFCFAILIRPKRNSLPKALALFSHSAFSLKYLDVAEF